MTGFMFGFGFGSGTRSWGSYCPIGVRIDPVSDVSVLVHDMLTNLT